MLRPLVMLSLAGMLLAACSSSPRPAAPQAALVPTAAPVACDDGGEGGGDGGVLIHGVCL
jgi:hypothetical protein